MGVLVLAHPAGRRHGEYPWSKTLSVAAKPVFKSGTLLSSSKMLFIYRRRSSKAGSTNISFFDLEDHRGISVEFTRRASEELLLGPLSFHQTLYYFHAAPKVKVYPAGGALPSKCSHAETKLIN